jgi:pilus assembly protein CpaB
VKRSNRLVILVGVLLAVLAFVGIVIFLGQEAPPPTALEPETVTVVVAAQDIEIGEPVTPDMADTIEVERDAVAPDAFRDPSQLTGRPSLYPIRQGTQITQDAFGVVGVVDVPAQLQPGEKAIAFQVERVTGLDFLIRPGDTIDIVVAQQITVLQPTADAAQPDEEDEVGPQRFETVAGLEDVRTVKTVLQAKRVLYVSDTRIRPPDEPAPEEEEQQQQQQPEAPIENVIIVFAGTDQDAEVIKFAQSNLGELGSLTAVLRHADDDAEEETTGITIDILVEQYGVPVPGIVNFEQLEPPSP